MGFTKSHLHIHWWHPIMNKVKHAFAVHFEEYHVHMSESDTLLSPGSMLLLGKMLPTNLPICEVDLSDHTHLASSLVLCIVELPPKGQMIGLHLAFNAYHNLLYIVDCQIGSCLLPFCHLMVIPLTWILSIASEEPITPLVTL